MVKKIVKRARSSEVADQIEPTGELPAKGIPANGRGGSAGGSNCPPGQTWNAHTRECEQSETGNSSKRSVPEPVARASSNVSGEAAGDETPEGFDVTDAAGSELPDDEEEGSNYELGGDGVDAGDDEVTEDDDTVTSKGPAEIDSGANADRVSEGARNRRYHAKVTKAERVAQKALEAQRMRIKAKQLRAQEMKIDAEILKAKEAARPQLNVMPRKGAFASGKTSAVEAEVSRPAAWFRNAILHKNVSPAFQWTLNKEKIHENYQKKYWQYLDNNDNPIREKVKASEADLTSVTGPPDTMRIMSEQVLVLPNGKVVTPIRQFCETKIIPAGAKEGFFYDFGAVSFSDIVEADDTIGTATPASSPLIRSAGTETNPRGTRVTIGYQQVEESPVDIVSAVNRAFALESVNDESKRVMISYNTDSGSSGDASTTKAIGAGTKTGRWVNGNTGDQITADASGLDKLTYEGLLAGKGVIQDEGLDDSNLITYTSGKAIRDLTLDPDVASYFEFSRPAVITEGTVERLAGTNLVRSSAIQDASQSGGKRSVMFIPNVAFGLLSGRDLTMEAQRVNWLQAIHVTGTQKIAGLVKSKEATCRISHL